MIRGIFPNLKFRYGTFSYTNFSDPRSYAKVTVQLLRLIQICRLPISGVRSDLSLRASHAHKYDLYSDSTNLIDLCMLPLDLRVTVYPDGGNRPVGVSCSTTSCSMLTEIRSQIETLRTDCRSHRPYPIYISHMQMIRTYNEAASALIPLKGRG